MNNRIADENFFFSLSAAEERRTSVGVRAPSRLKSEIYSALVRRQAESGPLLSLTETKGAGRSLCVFETLVQIAPIGEKRKHFNLCRVCHARILAERMENAPIFWGHCPYVAFQKH